MRLVPMFGSELQSKAQVTHLLETGQRASTELDCQGTVPGHVDGFSRFGRGYSLIRYRYGSGELTQWRPQSRADDARSTPSRIDEPDRERTGGKVHREGRWVPTALRFQS